MSLDRQPHISLKIESVNVGNSINVILTLDPNRAFNNKDIDDIQRVFNNIRNTQIERFTKALPSFDSLGPINPKSILMNPKILLGVILNRKGFRNLSELIELETPELSMEASTSEKVVSGATCLGGVIGTIATLPGVATGFGALATAGAAIPTAAACYDAYQKIFQEDKTVPIQPPPPTPPPSGGCDPRVQSCPPVLPPPCDPTIQSCPPIGPPPPPPKPKVIPIPPEKIRWVQTILKVANGESELVIDGLFGPKTHGSD